MLSLTNLLSFNVIGNNGLSPLGSECNVSLSIEWLNELAQLLLLFIHKCFCGRDDSVKLSSFLSFLFLLPFVLTCCSHTHIQWIMMMTLMWSRCIHYVPWNKRGRERERERRDNEWLKRNKCNRTKERGKNDKIEKEESKERKKEGTNWTLSTLSSSALIIHPTLTHSRSRRTPVL